MKTMCIVTLTMMLFSTAVGQNRSKIHHIIRKSAIESGYLPLRYRDNENRVQPISFCFEKLYGIIRIDQGGPVIDFWPIKNSDYTDKSNCISKNTQLGRFELDLSRKRLGDSIRYVNVPFSGWIFGIGTTPFRYRFKGNNLPSTVSYQIGINFSYGKYFGYSKISQRAMINYGMIIGPFAGITAVRLDRGNVLNPTNWTLDRTNAALSYGINIALTRNNLGIVISLGCDSNFGKDAEYWGFQNKPWLGIGINTYLGIL